MGENKSASAFGFAIGLLFGLICLVAWPTTGLAQGPGGCMGWCAAAQSGPWCMRWGGPGPGRMRWGGWMGPMRPGMGWMGDPSRMADRQLFNFLLDNRQSIRRTVTSQPDGVVTVTESDVPEIAAAIQQHVAAMHARLKEGRPIHLRDPLFAELFQNADRITIISEPTPKGLRVVETSTDPRVATLIQRHAEVIDRFLQNGRWELMTDHPVR